MQHGGAWGLFIVTSSRWEAGGEGAKTFIHVPGTELWLLTEVPSGGLSPTMLGSWALGGGEYTGGLDPCSCSNFFGTTHEKKRWSEGGGVGDGEETPEHN